MARTGRPRTAPRCEVDDCDKLVGAKAARVGWRLCGEHYLVRKAAEEPPGAAQKRSPAVSEGVAPDVTPTPDPARRESPGVDGDVLAGYAEPGIPTQLAYATSEPARWERLPTEVTEQRSPLLPSHSSMAGRPELVGYTEPRLFTPPLRPLTRQTSLGFECAEFNDRIGNPFLNWQRWVATHALELMPDGSFRFRVVLILVARQNGKSTLSRGVSLWKLYARGVRLVLGAAQNLGVAREQWEMSCGIATSVPALAAEIVDHRRANGQETLAIEGGGQYKIATSNRSGARGKSVDHLNFDELREQKDSDGWSALNATTMARPNAQIWCLSSAGDNSAVVLNQLREAALSGADPSIGLFEYSAADGCDLDDVEGWKHANPALGQLVSASAIRTAMISNKPADFRAEVLCQRVDQLDGAIDLAAWKDCKDAAGSLANYRDRLVVAVDVAPDGQHVTGVVAGEQPDGRVRVETVGAWESTEQARQALPDLVARIKPVLLAWFPGGPADALGADLRGLPDVEVVELRGSAVNEACQAFADLVMSRRIVQPDDPLLDDHVAGARKHRSGDGWKFGRNNGRHVDAAYALAGAVHGLRNAPEPETKQEPLMVVVA